MRKVISRATLWGTVGFTAVTVGNSLPAYAQTFVHTGGEHLWNSDANWGQAFPNGPDANPILPAPTTPITIDLGQPITLNTLTINKAVNAADANRTTVRGSATDTLTFVGTATVTNAYSSEGTGHTYIEAPVLFESTFTISQLDNDPIRFIQPLSGAGGVLLNRDSNGEGTIRFAAANTYAGATTLVGSGSTRYVTLRLDHDDAIPGGIGATGGTSNISLSGSGVIGLSSNDFKRSIGTGPDQIQFGGADLNGFAAYGANRVVNFGGAGAPVSWTTAGFGNLTFNVPGATHTLELQNPLDLGASARTIRVNDGSSAVDGRISATITSTGTANLTKAGPGTLALSAANTYTGRTIINSGAIRLEHAQALPAASNVTLTAGGVLHLAAGDYEATIGTGAGQLQFTVTGTNGNGGFAASEGTHKVTLNGGAKLTWGSANFATANLILSDDDAANGTVDFTNPIDLAGVARTFAVRDGSSTLDAKLTGVISGAGAGSIFLKSQGGSVELAAANTYEGVTQVNNGFVVLTNVNSIPGGVTGGNIANIQFSGTSNAVIGLGATDFTSGIGSGAGQVSFATDKNAGFAAYGVNRIVNLGGAAAPVVWNSGFVSGKFILGTAGSDATLDFQNPIDLNGASRAFLVRNSAAQITGQISNVISGASGSVIKEGAGTLAFTAANSYDGGTSIIAGRLLANNTAGSAVGTGDVSITTTGVLGGTGFVGTASDASHVSVQADGRINPGVTIGQLTISGNVAFAAGSFLDIDLDGGGFDKLAINGGATLDGTLNVVVPEGFVATPGSTFQILDATSGVTGQFSSVTWSGANTWSVQYGANSATLVAGALAGFAADFDLDGDVDAADLERWKTNYGLASGATKSLGDANGDGVVDGDDFLAWQQQFGSGVVPLAAAATAAVPEPTGFGLLLAAGLGALPFVRKRFRKSTLNA